MEYQINGSKITVTRKEESDGIIITILDGLFNALVLKIQDKKKIIDDSKKREK